MKLWIALLCTVIALQSMVVRSETWSCTWTNASGDPVIVIRQRAEDRFIDPTMPVGLRVVAEILYENDKVIHFYEELADTYYATLFNKTDKTFGMVGLGWSGRLIESHT